MYASIHFAQTRMHTQWISIILNNNQGGVLMTKKRRGRRKNNIMIFNFCVLYDNSNNIWYNIVSRVEKMTGLEKKTINAGKKMQKEAKKLSTLLQ